ncbi:MAG: aspartate carbamoyltransferase [Patescibacteria group bacterium]|nr:aspartate carbamoyltransferase [Patescibacteria group bacterium]MDE2588090.1 aspartate carbamoyltransferase [Patescibacteria group bacterium]
MPQKDSITQVKGNFKGKSILSLDQFSTSDLDIVFKQADKMKQLVQTQGGSDLLKGKMVAGLFYEPSSRTFTSFMTAAQRLGAGIIPLLGMQASSVAKGETIEDTIRTFGCNVDAVVMRHPQVGSVGLAAKYSYVPVLNAGDGIGEHPTQAVLDMFTIREKFGSLDNITGVLTGDLLNGRTTHSLIRGLSLFKNVTIYALTPGKLKLSREDYENFTERGVKIVEISEVADIPKNANFWYWTRVQKERFEDLNEYEALKHKYIMTKQLVTDYAGSDTLLMHPLPRVGEIETDVDTDPRAVYIKTQMQNGVYTRMALLALVLGKA